MNIDYSLLERLFKFGIVGGISFIIDFGLTYFCKEKLRLNKFIANTIGFVFSITFNFTLNRLWTFNAANADVGMQFMKFLTIASFVLIMNTILIYLLNVKIRMNFYLSKLIAVFIGMFFNYSMNSLYTFNNVAQP